MQLRSALEPRTQARPTPYFPYNSPGFLAHVVIHGASPAIDRSTRSRKKTIGEMTAQGSYQARASQPGTAVLLFSACHVRGILTPVYHWRRIAPGLAPPPPP